VKTYRILYRIGPHVPELKELEVDAVDNLAAVDRAREILALRYPHYRLFGVHQAGQVQPEPREVAHG